MRITAALLLVGMLGVGALAQRPRTIDNDPDKSSSDKTAPSPSHAPAPQSVKAKYEGGILGQRKKMDGSLSFDDENSRLVFRDKQQKEMLSIPYSSVSQAYSDTKSMQPKAASIVSAVPVPYGLNLPARFIKKKYRYLTMQFYDGDSQNGGLTSFKMDSKEIVESMVVAVADRSGLVPHGDVYAKPKGSSVVVGPYDPPTVARVTTNDRPAVFVENEQLTNRVISLPRPVYPEEAKASGATGVVRVSVTIDEQGKVSFAEAISGVSALQAAAVDAAKQAVFEPLLVDGRPMRTKTVIAYNFQLN